MADFGDPAVEAFIQQFREQFAGDDEWDDIVREHGLPRDLLEFDDDDETDAPAAPGGAAFGLNAGAAPTAPGPFTPGRFVPPPPRPVVTLPAPRPGLRKITVRIDVDDVEPAVWRRLELRSDLLLVDLHAAIQYAFDWADSHLHRFTLGPDRDVWRGPWIASQFDVEEGDELDEPSGIETEVLLDQVLRAPGDRLFYTYDFGDEWIHTITVEGVETVEDVDDMPAAGCIAGENAGPLDDCGGPREYTDLVADHAAGKLSAVRRRWLPAGWNPARFDADEANRALARVGRGPGDVVGTPDAALDIDPATPLGELLKRANALTQMRLLRARNMAVEQHVEPTEDDRRAALRPWLTLMGMLDDGGLPLTQAGYLRPAVVGELVDALGLRTFGTSRREMDIHEVTSLRESLKAMGYARHYRGELVLTKRGKTAAERIADGDTTQIWRDLASSLIPDKAPDGTRHTCMAIALMAAAGCVRGELGTTAAMVVEELGWMSADRRRLLSWEVLQIGDTARDPLGLIDVTGRTDYDAPYSPSARALAYDAMFGEGRTMTSQTHGVVGDLTFDVDEYGPADGVPVVMLHGFPESNAQWLSVATILADQDCRLVAPNLRGYSPGARPQGVENYAIDHLVGDVVGLLDALDVERAHLVGHDWGGTIGWFAAIRHPERFISYTAVSTAHPTAMLDAIATDEHQRAAMQYIKAFRADDAADRLMADDWYELRERCHGLPRDVFDDHARLLAEAATPTSPSALDAALMYYRAYGPRDAVDLGPCRIPTTYVWGENDFAFLPSAAHRTEAYVDAPYRFVPMPGMGHWISDLAPEVLADAIGEQIRQAG